MSLSGQAASESVTGLDPQGTGARGGSVPVSSARSRVAVVLVGSSPSSTSVRFSARCARRRERSMTGSAGAGATGTHRPSWPTLRLPSSRLLEHDRAARPAAAVGPAGQDERSAGPAHGRALRDRRARRAHHPTRTLTRSGGMSLRVETRIRRSTPMRIEQSGGCFSSIVTTMPPSPEGSLAPAVQRDAGAASRATPRPALPTKRGQHPRRSRSVSHAPVACHVRTATSHEHGRSAGLPSRPAEHSSHAWVTGPGCRVPPNTPPMHR